MRCFRHCRQFLLLIAACLVISTAQAADEPEGARLGTKIANVNFEGADGKPFALYDLAGKKAVVIIVLNFDCPNSTGYSPVLAEMARAYADRDVAFLGVCPNADEDAASFKKKADELRLGFPVNKDERSAAVGALKAEVTPEAFLLDHNFVLRYRGRIDDGYAARLKRNLVVTSHDLRNALDEVLAGKPVSNPLTRGVGCPIHTTREIRQDGPITYYHDVLPILQKHCQHCHRPGEVGPFSLVTYKQAVNWASDIKEYSQSRQMPPWKITEGIAFHNERYLSDSEIGALAAWVEGGTPEGNPSDAPPAKEFKEGWSLGPPDLVLEPQQDFILGPGGRDVFRCFVLPTNLDEDRHVIAYEVKPGNPRIVHHTVNLIDTSGRARSLEARAQASESDRRGSGYDRGPGYSHSMGVGFLPSNAIGGWAPGQQPYELPAGYSWRMRKGADLVVQVHYHRNGRVERDRTQIGLYFAKKTEDIKPFKGAVIPGVFLRIPAGDENYRVTGSAQAMEECTVHSIMPHMHLIGRSIRITMRPPGEETQTLLAIKDWDYNWQETYFLKQPLKLKPGTVLRVEAVYNNSSKNPMNPNNPPRIVIPGEQTDNEMCFVFLGVTSASRRLLPIVPGQHRMPEKNRVQAAAIPAN